MYGRDYPSSLNNRSYSSLRHGSGPLAGYTRSVTRSGGLADRYLQNANRGSDISISTNSVNIPSRTAEVKSRFERPVNNKSDDINLPPPEEKARINIGGRYLQRVNSKEENEQTARSSWRESVYGVQYKPTATTLPPSPVSPTPAAPKLERKNSLMERKRIERERQIQADKIRQQNLEEEREGRRLRQAHRKASFEKDQSKIREVDNEIKRRQKQREDSKPRTLTAETAPPPRQSSFKASPINRQENDAFEQVSCWQENNQKKPQHQSLPEQDETQIAMSYTDIDDYLRARLANGGKTECPWSTYYPENEVDDLIGEVSLVYKTRKAKDIFSKMPTELQNLVVRAHKRPVRISAIMDLCKTEKFGQEFSAESERGFRGYGDVASMLGDFGFDMTKVRPIIIVIIYFIFLLVVNEYGSIKGGRYNIFMSTYKTTDENDCAFHKGLSKILVLVLRSSDFRVRNYNRKVLRRLFLLN